MIFKGAEADKQLKVLFAFGCFVPVIASEAKQSELIEIATPRLHRGSQ